MIGPRPVGIARPARPGREGRIDRGVLPGRRAREHAQKLRGVLERRHDLFDRRDDDVRLRQDLREVAVAFVGDDDRGSGLGDEEVGAGDADVGGEELCAQHLARFRQQLLGLGETAVGRQIAMRLAEFLLDVLRQ